MKVREIGHIEGYFSYKVIKNAVLVYRLIVGLCRPTDQQEKCDKGTNRG